MFPNVAVGSWFNIVNCLLCRTEKLFSKYFDRFIITTRRPLSCFMIMALFKHNCFITSWCLNGVSVLNYILRVIVFFLYCSGGVAECWKCHLKCSDKNIQIPVSMVFLANLRGIYRSDPNDSALTFYLIYYTMWNYVQGSACTIFMWKVLQHKNTIQVSRHNETVIYE